MERREFLTASGALGALGLIDVGLPQVARSQTPDLSSAGTNARRIRQMDVDPKPLDTKSNDLTPFTGTWTDVQIRHALRRAMFGMPHDQFLEAKAMGSMPALVDRLINPSEPMPTKSMTYVD